MVSGSFMVLRSLMVFNSNSRSQMNIDGIKNVDMNIKVYHFTDISEMNLILGFSG